jgi:hypothetical protein
MRFWPTTRNWKRLVSGAAIVVALALIANGVMTWRAEGRLRAKIAAIHATGAPTSIAELAPQPIPDDENGAATLKRIEPRLTEFSKAYGPFFDTPLGKSYDAAQDRGERATREQIDAISAILNKYRDVDKALAKAAECDKYASQLDYSLPDTEFIEAMVNQSNTVRTAARFLAWEAEMDLANGKHEEAMKRGIQMLRLARHYENEPSLISYLVAIAIRGVASESLYDALSAGAVSPELHAALDDELARQDNPERLKHALAMERAISAGWAGIVPEQPSPNLARMFGWMQRSYQLGAVEYSEEYLRLAEQPWHEVRSQFGPADSPPPPSGHGILADLLAPALRATFQANARGLAVSRGLRIYNALREFKEKNGREARGLDELALSKTVTIDPYSGGPLKLKHTDDGWTIYSVMENGVDDGGDFIELKDYGLAPPRFRRTEKPERAASTEAQAPTE